MMNLSETQLRRIAENKQAIVDWSVAELKRINEFHADMANHGDTDVDLLKFLTIFNEKFGLYIEMLNGLNATMAFLPTAKITEYIESTYISKAGFQFSRPNWHILLTQLQVEQPK